MEPEGSLPHLQAPATCLYPEPEQSSQCLPSQLMKIYFNIIPPVYVSVFQVVSFPQVSPPKLCVHFSCPPYMPPPPPPYHSLCDHPKLWKNIWSNAGLPEVQLRTYLVTVDSKFYLVYKVAMWGKASTSLKGHWCKIVYFFKHTLLPVTNLHTTPN
jgi:hypothetical protein